MSQERKRQRPRVPMRLHIEQLHLHGFPEHARSVLLAELERELAAMLESRGSPGEATGQLQLERVRVDCAQAATLQHAGRDAARALFAHLHSHALVHGAQPSVSQARSSPEPTSPSRPGASKP
jgi:hypothetical protein